MILYLIPSPLAEDTLRYFAPAIAEIVGQTRHYWVENERTARRFLGSLGTGIAVRSLQLSVLDKDTTPDQVAELFRQVPVDEAVGVISEAGCPGIADPGALAVAHAHRLGVPVVPIPGPSSIFLALMGSGFSGQSFAFHGYLPIPPPERQKRIKQLEQDALRGQTQIFMETPYRNQTLFEELVQVAKPDTWLCIGANLTAADQLLRTQTVGTWRKHPPDLHKKPAILLLGKMG